MCFSSNSVGAPADTRYLDAWSGAQVATASMTEDNGCVAPRPGLLKNLIVRHQVAGGNGNPVKYTVRVNGINTLMTVTLATGAVGQLADVVNSAAVAFGDVVTLQAIKPMPVGGGTVRPTASMEFA